MTNKNVKRKLIKSIVMLMAPVVVGTIVVNKNDFKANASMLSNAARRLGTAGVRSGGIRNLSTGITSSGLQNAAAPGGTSSLIKPKLTKMEKVLGSISIGVGAISVLGTAIGLGLTESQFNQSKSGYEDVIKRTYDAFYDERQKYMEDLFNKWGVPLPDKYKNPLGKDKDEKPTPGFSFGGGK